MKAYAVGLLLVSLACHLEAADAITGKDIPQVLGVWYGQYQLAPDAPRTEMWMEISFQKPVNGYAIHGFNRWNVLTGEAPQGADSKGLQAQQFDTVSGRISNDGKTIRMHEDHSKARLDSTMLGTDSMRIEFTHPGQDSPEFSVTLERIDTHYSPADNTRLGIDISHHSGDVDWQQVKAGGYQFAYVKASEGVDNPDIRFADHWQALRALDFPRGAYHFYVTEDDPEQQAKFFASRLQDDPGTLPPVVDVELLGKNTSGDMTATLLRFLEVLEQQTGRTPMIYTDPAFWDRYFRPEFSRYSLWMSEVGVIMPKVPFGWQNWTLWQHQINQSVPGVEKDADISLLHPALNMSDIVMEQGAQRP